MRIYKTGYVSGAQVTRMYDNANNGTKGKGQQRYNTFCFKAFSSEQQPSYKAKGFSERIFTIKCSPGNPQYDISEVINDAGDLKHKKLFKEIDDLRKLLLIYRILHYNDQIPDVQLSIKNRDKQLCKPLIRLFNNTKTLEEIIKSLSKLLSDKNKKKLNSLDSYLFSAIFNLVKEENTAISNYDLWNIVCYLPGNDIPHKPHCYQTDEFGIISKTTVTKICEDKFGAVKNHNGEQRSLVFNKNTIQKLGSNYSQVQEIKVFSNNSLPNTFNTFWSNIRNNIYYKDDEKSETIIKSEQPNEEKSIDNNDKINNSKSFVNQVDNKNEEKEPFSQVSRVLHMVNSYVKCMLYFHVK